VSTILLGDVGGTNIRLVLKQVDLQNPSVGKVIKDGKTLS
jgi:glucokinase